MGGRPKITHGSQNNLTGNSRLNVRYTYTETLREPGGQVRNDAAVPGAATLFCIVCTLFVLFCCRAKLNFSSRGSIQIHLYLMLMWPSARSYLNLKTRSQFQRPKPEEGREGSQAGKLTKLCTKSQKAQSKRVPL